MGMLILTRRISEKIMIEEKNNNEPIEIIILGVDGKQVRIGIKAPNEFCILREELYLERENLKK